MSASRRSWILGMTAGFVLGWWSWAEGGLALTPSEILAAQDPGARLFVDHIRPVLEQCQVCHKPGQKNGGLDLSTREGLLRGGDSGPAVVPGNAGGSLLYKLVAHQQE